MVDVAAVAAAFLSQSLLLGVANFFTTNQLVSSGAHQKLDMIPEGIH